MLGTDDDLSLPLLYSSPSPASQSGAGIDWLVVSRHVSPLAVKTIYMSVSLLIVTNRRANQLKWRRKYLFADKCRIGAIVAHRSQAAGLLVISCHAHNES